jgi:hypothetical protein
MAASTQLFDLIQSLSGSEKRYFRLYCNLQDGEKNYLKLFDFLDGKEVYDEKEVKAAFQSESFVKSLHVTKNYLVNLILKSLRSFHSGGNSELKLNNLLSDFSILEKRGLYPHVEEILQKIKRVSIEQEKHHLLWWVLTKEMSFLMARREKSMEEDLSLLTDSFYHTAEILLKDTKALILNRKAGLASRSGYKEVFLSEQEKQFETELDRKNELSVLGYSHFTQFKAIRALLQNDIENHYLFYKQVVEKWKSEPALIKNRPILYKINLANLLNSCFRAQRFDEFPAILNELKKLPKGNFNEEAETFQNVAFYELLYYLNTGKVAEGLSRIHEIEKGLVSYKAKIHKSRELAFYYNLSLFYFIQHKYAMALDWLQPILNHPKTDHRKDLQRAAQLLQIVFHYMLDNMDLVSSLLTSVRKKFARQNGLNDFEALFFSNFHNLLKSVPGRPRHENEHKFFEAVNQFRQENKNLTLPLVDEVYWWLSNKVNP